MFLLLVYVIFLQPQEEFLWLMKKPKATYFMQYWKIITHLQHITQFNTLCTSIKLKQVTCSCKSKIVILTVWWFTGVTEMGVKVLFF